MLHFLKVNLGWILITLSLSALGLYNHFRIDSMHHESDIRVRNQLFLTALMLYSPSKAEFVNTLQYMLLAKEGTFPLDGLTVKVSLPIPGEPAVYLENDTLYLHTFAPPDSLSDKGSSR